MASIKNNIISLLTDFSYKDQYVGLLKAVILNINPKAKIIDLCHDIPPQDVKRAAYMLCACYRYFPSGTIHVVVVDPGVGTKRRIICVKAAGQYFIAPDNGVLTLIVEKNKPEFIINLTNKKYFLKKISHTFHGRDILAPSAAHLSKGLNPLILGKKIRTIKMIDFPKAVIKDKAIIGEVLYIDSFGNLVTNINERLLSNLGTRPEKTRIKIKSKTIYGIKSSYEQARIGGLLAIIGSTGNLEISANRRNAQRVVGAKPGDKVILA